MASLIGDIPSDFTVDVKIDKQSITTLGIVLAVTIVGSVVFGIVLASKIK